MTERNHYDDFEYYLQQQVNQHRIYPSDALWQNIQEEIHGRWKWRALPLVALLVVAAITLCTVFLHPDKNILKQPVAVNTLRTDTVDIARETSEAYAMMNEKIAPHSYREQATTVTTIPATTGVNRVAKDAADSVGIIASATRPATVHGAIPALTVARIKEKATSLSLPGRHLMAVPEKIHPLLKVPVYRPQQVELKEASLAAVPRIRLAAATGKSSIDYYITPSYSYRFLLDDQYRRIVNDASLLVTNPNYTIDVNRAVRHKPAFGFSAGINYRYALSSKVHLLGGVLFAMRQYNIDAYVYNYESSTVGNSSTMTNLRNNGGSYAVTLENRYYEFAIPLGIDFTLLRSKKLDWNMAFSIQPTMVMNTNPFIISNDLKNYASGGRMMRNFNLNNSIETYVSYNTGKNKWHIGPELRYQILSSYSARYPVQEHLFNYGVRVGVIHTLGK